MLTRTALLLSMLVNAACASLEELNPREGWVFSAPPQSIPAASGALLGCGIRRFLVGPPPPGTITDTYIYLGLMDGPNNQTAMKCFSDWADAHPELQGILQVLVGH